MRRARAALAALALTGCATSALDMAPPAANMAWAPTVSSAGAIIAGPAGNHGGTDYVLPPNPLLGTLPPPPLLDPNHSYGLAELIDIAESNNPQTRIAWDQARQAALAAGIAESTYLPQITASAVGAYQNSDAHESAAGLNGSGNDEAHGVISALSVNWLLFDFGERSAVITAAKQLSIVSNIGFTAAQSLLTAAQTSYDAAFAAYRHGVGSITNATVAGTQLLQA